MNRLHRTATLSGLARRVGVVMAALALLGGGAALAQEGTPTFTPASEHEEPDDPCDTDPTLEGCDEPDEPDEPTAEQCLADPSLEGCEEPGEATAEECLAAEPTLEGCDEPADAGDTRSETAQAVHRALTATEEAPDGLLPGDAGFGQAVAANAQRRGGNGAAVSSAARGENEPSGAVEGAEELDGAATGHRGNRPSQAGGPKR